MKKNAVTDHVRAEDGGEFAFVVFTRHGILRLV